MQQNPYKAPGAPGSLEGVRPAWPLGLAIVEIVGGTALALYGAYLSILGDILALFGIAISFAFGFGVFAFPGLLLLRNSRARWWGQLVPLAAILLVGATWLAS